MNPFKISSRTFWIVLLKYSGFGLFLFCFVFLSGLSIYYYFFKYPKMRKLNPMLEKHYSKDIILQTGGRLILPKTKQHRIQNFLNFPRRKKKGSIRIGAFGDSSTYGSEVDPTETYPYQLQELLNQNFPDKPIEVLNFGVSGIGFQSSWFLWKKYATSYQLDYILLGPQCFQSARDTTFRRSLFVLRKPFRERFIFTNGKLKKVHIKGKTLEERYRNYKRLLPPRSVFLYDRRPAHILWMNFSFFRNKIAKPFYYSNMSRNEESTQINKLLLKKINKRYNKKILFLTIKPHIEKFYSSFGKAYNLNIILSAINSSVYWKISHYSSLGNELVARIYYHALRGEENFSLKKLHCEFSKTSAPALDKTLDMDSVKSIEVMGAAQPLMFFIYNRKNITSKQQTYLKHKIPKTKSFIAFSNTNNPFFRYPFFPLNFHLQDGMEVYLEMPGGSKIKLGRIKNLFQNFFIFYKPYIRNKYISQWHGIRTLFMLQDMPSVFQQIQKIAQLVVGKHRIGHLSLHLFRKDRTLLFHPASRHKKSFFMAGAWRGHIREKNFPEKFPLYLQFNMENGDSFKLPSPIGRCEKRKEQIHLNLPHFKPIQ